MHWWASTKLENFISTKSKILPEEKGFWAPFYLSPNDSTTLALSLAVQENRHPTTILRKLLSAVLKHNLVLFKETGAFRKGKICFQNSRPGIHTYTYLTGFEDSGADRYVDRLVANWLKILISIVVHKCHSTTVAGHCFCRYNTIQLVLTN